MNILQSLFIRMHLRRVRKGDIAAWRLSRNTGMLRLALRHGSYRERAGAALALGQLKAWEAIPELSALLYDDFKQVAGAARQALTSFLPDESVARVLALYDQRMEERERLREERQKHYWFDQKKWNDPMIDKRRMAQLEKVKTQLQKSIRFW